MKRLLCTLLMAALPAPLAAAQEADATRWFRGVETVNPRSAGIGQAITLNVRDLDGWLFNQIERKTITGDKQFKGNQLELFLAHWQKARSVGRTYGDLMQEEREKLEAEFGRLAVEKAKLARMKLMTAAAPAVAAEPGKPAVAPVSFATEEKKLDEARAVAEAAQEMWFTKWQAFHAYTALLLHVKEDLYLVLNGSRLTHVKASNPFEPGAGGRKITIYALEFVLKQHPEDKPEWDKLYRGIHRWSPATVTAGFDMDGKSFTLDSEVQPALSRAPGSTEKKEDGFREFALVTYSLGSLMAGLGLVAISFVFFIYLAGRTELVRDPDSAPRPDGTFRFSLARCQMSFWFFLFAAAYIFLWVVKRQTDTLTDQCLILLGISTGTTLGVAVLSKAVGSAAAPPAAPGEPRETYLQRPAAQRFFEDLLSDQNQISFHRFQMVVWTLVLGLVFIRSVCTQLQMPEFGTNELTLMGISAGTYIGFSIPAASKKTAPPPDAGDTRAG